MALELQSCKCVSQPKVHHCLAWSDDDYVASAGEKGVYITKIQGSLFSKDPPIIKSTRFFLRVGSEIRNETWCIPDRLLCKVRTHRPSEPFDLRVIPLPCEKKLQSTVKQIAWSPSITKRHRSTYLTVLTLEGSLKLFQLNVITKKWEVAACISEFWKKSLCTLWEKQDLPQTPTSQQILQLISDRNFKSKITTFSWGNVYDGVEQSWTSFFTGTMKGDILAWKIKHLQKSLDVEIFQSLKTNLGPCTAVFSYGEFVLCGCEDGRVLRTQFKVDKEVISWENVSIVWDNPDLIQLQPQGFAACETKDGAIFVICKSVHLLCFHFENGGSFRLIGTFEVRDMEVTGLVTMSESEFLIASRSGNLHVLNINQKLMSLTPISSSVRSESFACFGIASSHNKAIIAQTFSMYKNFDHLAMKQPSQIVFITLPGTRNAWQIIKNLNGSLTKQWDAFEVLRLQQLARPSYITCLGSYKPSSDLNFLKKHLWLAQIGCLSYKGDRLNEAKTALENYKDLLLTHHLINVVRVILEKDELDDFHVRVLQSAKTWFGGSWYHTHKMNEDVVATITELLTLISQTKAGDETCFLCGENLLSTTSRIRSECYSKHVIPRCVLSFIQLDVSSVFQCLHCYALAHPKAVADFGSDCPLCDKELHISS